MAVVRGALPFIARRMPSIGSLEPFIVAWRKEQLVSLLESGYTAIASLGADLVCSLRPVEW